MQHHQHHPSTAHATLARICSRTIMLLIGGILLAACGVRSSRHVDFSTLLVQPGDLPAEFSVGPFEQVTEPALPWLEQAAPAQEVTQVLTETSSGRSGGVTLWRFHTPGEAATAYAASTNFEGGGRFMPAKGAEYLMIGEERALEPIDGISLMPEGVFANTVILFKRCTTIVRVSVSMLIKEISESPQEPVAIAYARRLDERLKQAVCGK